MPSRPRQVAILSAIHVIFTWRLKLRLVYNTLVNPTRSSQLIPIPDLLPVFEPLSSRRDAHNRGSCSRTSSNFRPGSGYYRTL